MVFKFFHFHLSRVSLVFLLNLSPVEFNQKNSHGLPRLLPPCEGPSALLHPAGGDCRLGLRSAQQQAAAICFDDDDDDDARGRPI